MGISVETLALAKGYTDESIAGGGISAGKNCVIDSITAVTGGHKVVFGWYLDNGTHKTGEMTVMDGAKGDTGLGVKSIAVNASNHLIVTYDDDTTEDAGEITNITTDFAHISDIDIDNAEDGQVLKYNGTTHKWENASAGSVDTNLEDLNDVDFTTLTDGQIIVWDATSHKWKNADNSPTITVDNALSDSSENPVQNKVVKAAIDEKQNAETGKGLSKNDYTDADKAIVDGVTAALAGKVDKDGSKTLTDNNYSNADKAAVDALGTASTKDVAASGDASTTEVVMGNDTRLSDTRDPKAHTHTLSDITDAGTAAAKDVTTYVNPDNNDIPTSNAVYQAMTSMLEGAFHPSGNKTCAELTSALLIQANVGNVYDITDSGVTTANWVGGAGQTIEAGQMAVIVYGNEPNTFLFNLRNGIDIDLSDYQTKAITPIEVDGVTKSNVEDAVDAINVLAGSNKTAISGIKNGQNIDSFADVETVVADKTNLTVLAPAFVTTRDYAINSYVTHNGKLYKCTTAHTAGEWDSNDFTEITVSGAKADKVSGATSGHFASLNGNGNLQDSGKSASDFADADVEYEIADIVNVYGAKNLIPTNNMLKSESKQNLEWTPLADGAVRVNGTASALSVYDIINTEWYYPFKLKAGSYILSCDGLEEDVTYVAISIMHNDDTVDYNVAWVSGTKGVPKLTLTDADIADIKNFYLGVAVYDGQTVNNVILKPMLRLASITDDTYVPYVPTNATLDAEKVSYDDAAESVQKNLLKYPYHETTVERNGITWIDLGDGRIKANGTATDNSSFTFSLSETKLSAGAYLFTTNTATSGIADSILNDDSGNRIARGNSDLTTTTPSNTNKFVLTRDMSVNGFLRVFSGQTVSNLIFKPMIRKATIKDDTWQPYIPNNKELVSWKANGELGAKNMIPFPYYNMSGTHRGITFTANSDGSVSFTGTATEGNPAQLLLVSSGLYKLKAGKYTISGGSSNYGGVSIFFYDDTSHTNYSGFYQGLLVNQAGNVFIMTTETGTQINASNLYGYSKTFTILQDAYVDIAARSTTTAIAQAVSGTIYPMLRRAEDTDDTYQPYAMTNRELTEVKTLTPTITSSAYTMTYQSVKRCGNIVQVWIRLKLSNSISAGGNADGTVSGIPFPIGDIMNLAYNSANVIGILFQTNGTLRIRAFSTLDADTDVDATFTYIAKQ